MWWGVDRLGGHLPLGYPSYRTPLGMKHVFYRRYTARIYNDFRLPLLTHLPRGRRRFVVSFIGSDKDLGSVTGDVKIDCPAMHGVLSSLVRGLAGVGVWGRRGGEGACWSICSSYEGTNVDLKSAKANGFCVVRLNVQLPLSQLTSF